MHAAEDARILGARRGVDALIETGIVLRRGPAGGIAARGLAERAGGLLGHASEKTADVKPAEGRGRLRLLRRLLEHLGLLVAGEELREVSEAARLAADVYIAGAAEPGPEDKESDDQDYDDEDRAHPSGAGAGHVAARALLCRAGLRRGVARSSSGVAALLPDGAGALRGAASADGVPGAGGAARAALRPVLRSVVLIHVLPPVRAVRRRLDLYFPRIAPQAS